MALEDLFDHAVQLAAKAVCRAQQKAVVVASAGSQMAHVVAFGAAHQEGIAKS